MTKTTPVRRGRACKAHVGTAFAAVYLAIVLTGACARTTAGTATAADPTDIESPTTPQPTPVEDLKDRDPDAVMAALRELDTCKLIEASVGPRVGLPASTQIRDRGPHQCSLVEPQLGDALISVAVGAHFDHGLRYHAAPVDVGPAPAYQRLSSLGGTTCMVDMPVSFELSVRVETEARSDRTSDSCAQAREFATAAATKLANPDALRVDPTKAPMAQWDACTILKAATDPESAADTFIPGVIYSYAGIDACESKRGFQLMLRYVTQPNMENAPSVTVGGIAVKRVEYDTKRCEMQWSNGPLPRTNHPRFGQFVAIKAQNCAAAEALAAATMKVLTTAPPSGPPHRPVLIGPGEPDDPAPGACLHLSFRGSYKGCRPAQQRPVPKTTSTFLAAAERDPDVVCAAAKPAVTKHFGDTAQPVVFESRCLFVEPSHTAIIVVAVSASSAPREHTKGHGGSTVDIASHPAISMESDESSALGAQKDYNLYISTRDDLDQPGMVRIGLSCYPPRGTAERTEPDTRKAGYLTPAATDLVAAHVH